MPLLDLQNATLAELRDALAAGRLRSVELVRGYLARIDELDGNGPSLNAVLEVNPDAEAIAAALDRERADGKVRGPLHGIPLLLKDNIDTADQMQTTAGSLALLGAPPAHDATVVARLRTAGAVILGKTNLSEWANYRSSNSSSGWCGRNGQSRNPHVLDRSPSGSSSGSGVAVAAGLCAAALGTETDGSIVSPASANGVVGIKPTVGLTSRAGVVPIAHSQDTVGPLARTVEDAALVLGALVGVDERDPATVGSAEHLQRDYTRFLDLDGLRGARIGVARNLAFGANAHADAITARALEALREAGAELVDPANISSDLNAAQIAEREVLRYEFKADIAAYLATRHDVALLREGFAPTLAGLIAFNERHREEEMPYFGQSVFIRAQQAGDLGDPAYQQALETSRRLSGQEGLDAVLDELQLDALVAPTMGPARLIDLVNGEGSTTSSCGVSARAGYPLVSIPAGNVRGLPLNITFIGRAYSEPTLIRLAYAYEQRSQARITPRYLPTLAW